MSDDVVVFDIPIKAIVGVAMVFLPFIGLSYVIFTGDVMPILGSPFVAIFMWGVGGWLISDYRKQRIKKS